MDNTTTIMTDEEIIKLAQERGITSVPEPKTTFGELKEMKEEHRYKEEALKALAVAELPEATEEQFSQLVKDVLKGKSYAREHLEVAKGYRLTEEQTKLLDKAKEDRIRKINSDDGRAQASEWVEGASELTKLTVGRPTKSGKRAGLLPFAVSGYIGGEYVE